VPLHHDEGVNGNFLVRLVREGAYNYDPANYHGPTLYYFAAVMPIYRWSHERLGIPPFFQDGAEIGYYPIRFYNRRLVKIAQRKKALGIYGNRNAGVQPKFVGFSVRSSMWVMLFHGLLRWAKAEIANAWTHVVKPRPMGRREAEAAAPAVAETQAHGAEAR